MGGRGSAGGGAKSAMNVENHGGFAYVTQHFGGGYGKVGVLQPGGGEIGSINWMPGSNGPEVGDLHVSESFRRKGIASQLWRQAQKATSGRISHSANRTEAGDAFARKVGGNVPRRSSLRPT